MNRKINSIAFITVIYYILIMVACGPGMNEKTTEKEREDKYSASIFESTEEEAWAEEISEDISMIEMENWLEASTQPLSYSVPDSAIASRRASRKDTRYIMNQIAKCKRKKCEYLRSQNSIFVKIGSFVILGKDGVPKARIDSIYAGRKLITQITSELLILDRLLADYCEDECIEIVMCTYYGTCNEPETKARLDDIRAKRKEVGDRYMEYLEEIKKAKTKKELILGVIEKNRTKIDSIKSRTNLP